MNTRSLGGGSCDYAQDDGFCDVPEVASVVILRAKNSVILREVAGPTRADNATRSRP